MSEGYEVPTELPGSTGLRVLEELRHIGHTIACIRLATAKEPQGCSSYRPYQFRRDDPEPPGARHACGRFLSLVWEFEYEYYGNDFTLSEVPKNKTRDAFVSRSKCFTSAPPSETPASTTNG